MITRLAVSFLVTTWWAGVATAGIFSTTGAVQFIIPPASVVNTDPNTQQDGVIHLFQEQIDVTLNAPVTADMTVHYTTYDPPVSGRTLGTIPTNTVVTSYYIHYDPVAGGPVDGTVTFDEPILGVICEGDPTGGTNVNDPPGDTLSPTNFLGGPTIYPGVGDGNLQGIEDAPDRITLDENTVVLRFGASDPGDRVRVLTAAIGTTPLCGNGALDGAEGCDDSNFAPGDGCFGCQPETCFACAGAGPTCTPIVTCTNGDGCCAPGCTAANDNDCPSLCSAGKVKCVSKKKSCKLKCYATAAKHGVAVDAACLTKCETKFNDCFATQESIGACYTTGDVTAIENKIDAFVLDVVQELDAVPVDDLNECRAKKLKCVDTYDKCILGALMKSVKTGNPVNNGKIAKCQSKFDGGANPAKACFTKAEINIGGCETTGDITALQNKDDAFIGDVICELGKCQLY